MRPVHGPTMCNHGWEPPKASESNWRSASIWWYPRSRLPVRNTVALEIPQDGRMIYVVTWNQSVLIGTTDTFYGGDKESLPVTAEAVEYLLAGVNRYFPQAGLTAADVLATFVVARPLLGDGKEETEDAVSRDYEIINAGPGRWAITGGKLTTYRAMAERLVDQVVGHEFRARSLAPAQRPAPWSEPSSLFRPTRHRGCARCGRGTDARHWRSKR